LLELGAYRERRGEYDEAVALLERLTDVAPDTREGRLRLAVNLRRVGRAADAGRTLRQLLEGPVSDWVAVIATEELADLYVRGGRFATAVGVLEQGIRRFPERSRLRIQLAYALDRLGEAKRTAAVLDRLDPRPATAGRSPRFVYNRLSSDDRARVRETLVREANARLASLAAALGG